MPTIFTHAAVGFAASKLTLGQVSGWGRIVAACAAVAALPDADALFLRWIPYDHPLGHRGFTHSLVFALLTGLALAVIFKRTGWGAEHSFTRLAVLFAAVTASHGLFDAMTSGGLGVAFFAPFDNSRYFLPWRPIPVAPLSARGLFTSRGARLLIAEGELFWTFAIGAAAWSPRVLWRKAGAAVCWSIGAVMWIRALG